MNQRRIVAFAGLVLTFIIGCGSTDSSAFSNSRTRSTSYFTGSGGKGISLGILVPESNGLSENQAYLPRMVQGTLVSDISKYSAITILDRVSLDRVIAETLDPAYGNNFDIVRLGHVAQVKYMMTGSIMRISSGYSLQLNVTETTPDAPTVASYSGTCTVAQFDDFSAIHRASKELLAQMGIQLTDAAKRELDKPSTVRDINAQTNLAQGIVAQQKGTVIEAMAYYYNAVSFDPKLSEANGRLSTLSSNVTSGNIGENVRNDIQRRNAWLEIIKECEDFFDKHPPYEIVYYTKLTQGQINYEKETVRLICKVDVMPTNGFQIVNDILKGLETTGKKQEWGIGYWPLNSSVFSDGGRNPGEGSKGITISLRLLNSNKRVIATTNRTIRMDVNFANIRHSNYVNYKWDERINFRAGSTSISRGGNSEDAFFSEVNANDITDNLTIEVVSVNGINKARNPDYIKVTAR